MIATVRRAAVGLCLLLLLTGTACDSDRKYDSATYCDAILPTVNGAVDANGKPLAQFGPAQQLRSYKRLARLAPNESSEDWETVGELISGGATPDDLQMAFEAEDRLKSSVEQTCDVELDVSLRRTITARATE